MKRQYFRSTRCALVACAITLGACRTPQPADGGIRIGDKTLEQFKAGDTSENWLTSIIGPPTTRIEVTGVGEPVSILRYSIIERSRGGPFSLFMGSPPPKTTATIYFVVRSGIVTQFWADREATPTLLGKKTNEAGDKKE